MNDCSPEATIASGTFNAQSDLKDVVVKDLVRLIGEPLCVYVVLWTCWTCGIVLLDVAQGLDLVFITCRSTCYSLS